MCYDVIVDCKLTKFYSIGGINMQKFLKQTFKNNETIFRAKCEEISVGNLNLYEWQITEVWNAGILSYILIQVDKQEIDFNKGQSDFVTVKYANGVYNVNFKGSEYMADISYAEVTKTNCLILNIEPSGFHFTLGKGCYSF